MFLKVEQILLTLTLNNWIKMYEFFCDSLFNAVQRRNRIINMNENAAV